jgi:glycosyltransferase involved in cell wall biosynthesis
MDGILFKNDAVPADGMRSFFLPNGVDLRLFRPMDRNACRERLGLSPSAIYALFVSSNLIRGQKRLDRFEEVLAILRRDTRFAAIQPLIISRCERAEVPFYIGAANVHILCSDFEGSPNSVKECMACNVPVVSTPVGNVPAMLNGVPGCRVATSFEATELAALTAEVLAEHDNPSMRDHLVRQGLDSAAVATSLRGIYDKLLAS